MTKPNVHTLNMANFSVTQLRVHTSSYDWICPRPAYLSIKFDTNQFIRFLNNFCV